MRIPVRYNHVGYAPGSAKIFFVNPKELPQGGLAASDCFFRIVRRLAPGASVAFEGTLGDGSFEHRGVCGYTGEVLWSGNFSEVSEPGEYAIQVWRNGRVAEILFETPPFAISDGWLFRQLLANIKSFYYQRSGVALVPEFAGKWSRPAAHRDDTLAFHPSMRRAGVWNAHGGWYDAGDYGKYVVNGGVSVATLLLACELVEDSLVSAGPEKAPVYGAVLGGAVDSGDGLKQYSLIDEVRFELEFFLRMQDADGGVFFKVTPEHWDGFVSPRESDLLQKRLILGKSTTSTLNFAAVMASAGRVYRYCDAAFAECCLQSAVAAYCWAVERPFVDWPHNTEGSGGYGDEHAEDEFFWARAMLYRELLTRGGTYGGLSAAELRPLLLDDVEKLPPKFGVDWRDTQNLGWMALALQDLDVEMRSLARRTLENTALEIVKAQRLDAYGISLSRFIWGSNGEIANHALTLAVVRRWKDDIGPVGTDEKCEKESTLDFWCRELLNFIYGRNPVDVCFVTGAAWSSPMCPHHRLSHSDGIVEPIPGLLVGGINSDRQDLHRAPHYSGNMPGFSYTDEHCSFASNETAINWNAPLTAVLALLCC